MPLMGDAYMVSSEAWMRDRHMPITKGEAAILVRMLRGERQSKALGYPLDPPGGYAEDELTFCHPGGWYIGTDRQSPKVCRSLVRRAYLSTTDQYDADYQTWQLNEDGRRSAENAERGNRTEPNVHCAHCGVAAGEVHGITCPNLPRGMFGSLTPEISTRFKEPE